MRTELIAVATGRCATRRVGATSGLVLLVALVVLPLLVEGGSLTHVHRAHDPGIFNEEHVLAAAAAVKADAPLSVLWLIATPLLTSAAAPAATPALLESRFPLHSDPRAPPTL
jgi:hypothetical protein